MSSPELENPVQRAASEAGASQHSSKFVVVDFVTNEKTQKRIAIIRLARKPVNSLNTELIADLSRTVQTLEKDDTVTAFVLTSTIPGIFSAGLDLMEMHQVDKPKFFTFWTSLRRLFEILFLSPLVSVAAISGHSPAGGCLLALTCDYRIMLDGKYTIGLNEVAIGLVAPQWFIDPLVLTVGHRQAEKLLELGSLLSVSEALRIGLIDELAEREADLLPKALATAHKYSSVPAAARAQSKAALRQPVVESMRRHDDTQDVFQFMSTPAFQANLGQVLARLSAASAAKPKTGPTQAKL
eukprot:CAMPEP_0196660578 /NCGR_PEP_ID=MMETSP1086-20130531/40460_1 /TAXON_ID=77921 /ORGANISM="Cyanoptyche  gloeocystis , Strain SAG4.97" /LENGTH=296 /DNA_ID=CAMNT_0041995057 /DNA_START=25 /DNA_END=915 /DNA_ORIENTATION=-